MEKKFIHDWLKALPSKKQFPESLHIDPRHALDTFTAGLSPLRSLTVIQMEMITWWSRRAQAVLSVPQRLTGCKTHTDLMQEQNRFWQIAYTHNQEAVLRIAQAWSDLLWPYSSFSSSSATKSSGPSFDSKSLIKFPAKGSDKETEPHSQKKKIPSKRDVYSS